MNILYTLTSYPPATGGAQQHFHEIARRLSVSDSVRVIRQWDTNRQDWLLGTTWFAPRLKAAAVDGVPTEGLALRTIDKVLMTPGLPLFYGAPQVFTPWVSSFFLKRLREIAFKPDLIHHGRIGRENLGFASLERARELGVPFVLTPFHHPRWVGWRYRQYLSLYREADHVFALTHSERETLADLGVSPEKITVIGHGPTVLADADGTAFRDHHGLGTHPVILFLGQKYPYKGFQSLLDAAPAIWERLPETRLLFIGPRTAESKRTFAAIRDPRILELDAVPIAEKCAALAACDLFVLPSVQESFGGVYVEAWMYGKPVIGGRIAAIADVIDEGVNGLLTTQDPVEIARTSLDLLTNRDRARQMGEAGRRKGQAVYSWEPITSRVRETYARMIQQKYSQCPKNLGEPLHEHA